MSGAFCKRHRLKQPRKNSPPKKTVASCIGEGDLTKHKPRDRTATHDDGAWWVHPGRPPGGDRGRSARRGQGGRQTGFCHTAPCSKQDPGKTSPLQRQMFLLCQHFTMCGVILLVWEKLLTHMSCFCKIVMSMSIFKKLLL